MRLLTLNFEDDWEDMVMTYLNGCFVKINDDRIEWGRQRNNRFYKPKKILVETKSMQERLGRKAYKVEYDHYMEVEDTIYLFDSKYFNEVRELNYKQLFYHYQLKQKYPNKTIVNGLLLPTEKSYYTQVHVDRTDLDDIKIVEHYINLRVVMRYYQKAI